VSLSVSSIRKILLEHDLLEFLPESSLEPLARFTQKMLDINQTLNLTKWIQVEDVLQNHILDSAFGLPNLKKLMEPVASSWMDLGTGGGFPGALVVAAFPSWQTTFVDSVLKKGQAVQQCLNAAGWQFKTLVARAEDLGRNPTTRETWDGVVARAVADLPVLLEYAVPLLKVGGHLVTWMTENQIKDLYKSENAFNLLHVKIIEKKQYRLPNLSQNRWILVMKKFKMTSIQYPRFVGQPSKKPL
jgi:16S rRNA (guanine527-N7)-methyltransferase